jgi:predicted nucleotide-binding protein
MRKWPLSSKESEPQLIVVSIIELRDEPFIGPDRKIAKRAIIRGESSNPELSFEFTTGLLNPEQREHCEVLQRHGSTVVEAPPDWRFGYHSPIIWQESVVRSALEQVAAIPGKSEGESMSGYDVELAERVLEVLNRFFPKAVGAPELKKELQPEPSDERLLIAIEALEIDKMIDAKLLRTGYDQVARAAMNIRINGNGRKHLAERTNPKSSPARIKQGANNPTARKAFIVHGHEHGLKETVARFLEKLDIEPIILHEQADKGRTLIEKFEEHAGEVQYAVVILSGDDLAHSKSEPAETESRARQNVIFEFGFFVGRLGRTHTFALLQKDVALPSDMNGIIYIKLEDNNWRFLLAREFKAAGLDIDMNKV